LYRNPARPGGGIRISKLQHVRKRFRLGLYDCCLTDANVGRRTLVRIGSYQTDGRHHAVFNRNAAPCALLDVDILWFNYTRRRRSAAARSYYQYLPFTTDYPPRDTLNSSFVVISDYSARRIIRYAHTAAMRVIYRRATEYSARPPIRLLNRYGAFLFFQSERTLFGCPRRYVRVLARSKTESPREVKFVLLEKTTSALKCTSR